MSQLESVHDTGTFERQLFVWSKEVEDIERGYRGNEHDYHFALFTRDCLEKYITLVSPGIQAKLRDALDPLDRRFNAATKPAEKDVGLDRSSPPYPNYPEWWWGRVPSRIQPPAPRPPRPAKKSNG